jgi:hypothetical protein
MTAHQLIMLWFDTAQDNQAGQKQPRITTSDHAAAAWRLLLMPCNDGDDNHHAAEPKRVLTWHDARQARTFHWPS